MKLGVFSFVTSLMVISLVSVQVSATGDKAAKSDALTALNSYQFLGGNYDEIFLDRQTRGSINLKGCEDCEVYTYKLHPWASKRIGKKTYRISRTDFIIEEHSGVFMWAYFKKGIGRGSWSLNDPYNVFAKDSDIIDEIRKSEGLQNSIKESLAHYGQVMQREYKASKTPNLVSRSGLLKAMF